MSEREPIQLSELQHFAFCRRQWALIHIEEQWADNERTVDGDLFHRRAHDAEQFESRGDLLIARGLRVQSRRLNLTGVCDVVEFHSDPKGVSLAGRDGLWRPYPVEYKRGSPKPGDADILQLCAQALCLEEMLLCDVPEGSLFYGETRRRERVEFMPELRGRVEEMLAEMQALRERGHTPRAKPSKGCNACSLKDVCLPKLSKLPSVGHYLRTQMREDTCESS